MDPKRRTMFGVHRNGLCYNWNMLQRDYFTKELKENDLTFVKFHGKKYLGVPTWQYGAT